MSIPLSCCYSWEQSMNPDDLLLFAAHLGLTYILFSQLLTGDGQRPRGMAVPHIEGGKVLCICAEGCQGEGIAEEWPTDVPLVHHLSGHRWRLEETNADNVVGGSKYNGIGAGSVNSTLYTELGCQERKGKSPYETEFVRAY